MTITSMASTYILDCNCNALIKLLESRGESGWCSDVTSTHGAWRHAGVRFPLSGVFITHEIIKTFNMRIKFIAERGFDPRTFGL